MELRLKGTVIAFYPQNDIRLYRMVEGKPDKDIRAFFKRHTPLIAGTVQKAIP